MPLKSPIIGESQISPDDRDYKRVISVVCLVAAER